MKISLRFRVDQQKVIDCSTEFLPKATVALVESEIDLVDDLPDIDWIRDPLCFFKLFVVGLMHNHTIGVAFFDEVDELLSDHQDSFVPFSLDIVGPFVMDGCKHLSGAEDPIWDLEIGVKVFISWEFEVLGLTHSVFERLQTVGIYLIANAA